MTLTDKPNEWDKNASLSSKSENGIGQCNIILKKNTDIVFSYIILFFAIKKTYFLVNYLVECRFHKHQNN